MSEDTAALGLNSEHPVLPVTLTYDSLDEELKSTLSSWGPEGQRSG